MSVESVRRLFEEENLSDAILYSEVISDTVEHAAELIGCKPKEIAKTMSFLIDEDPIVIVTAGDAKIDNAKYKSRFGVKAKMIHYEDVERYTGHIPGGVSPFALKENVKVYLDVSLKRFEIVYAGAGDEHHTVKVTLEQLERLSTSCGWVDVCKDWMTESN